MCWEVRNAALKSQILVHGSFLVGNVCFILWNVSMIWRAIGRENKCVYCTICFIRWRQRTLVGVIIGESLNFLVITPSWRKNGPQYSEIHCNFICFELLQNLLLTKGIIESSSNIWCVLCAIYKKIIVTSSICSMFHWA